MENRILKENACYKLLEAAEHQAVGALELGTRECVGRGQRKEVLAVSGSHVSDVDVSIPGDVQQNHIWVRLGQNFGWMQALELL